MASQDTTIVGLSLVKINGMFHLDVRNIRVSVKRANPQVITGAGAVQAIGEAVCSGTFDEVIPRSKQLNWRKMKNFTIEVMDKEEKNTIFSAEGCNWNDVEIQSNQDQATTGRSVGWNGNKPTYF